MVIAALVLAGIAALVHVYIFTLESVTWTSPRTRATFGVRSVEEAETTRDLAYNQGFYNLFLAIVTAVGIVLAGTGSPGTASYGAGAALVFAGAGSMAAAAIVLVTKSPRLARSALVQGLVPLVTVVLLAIGMATA